MEEWIGVELWVVAASFLSFRKQAGVIGYRFSAQQPTPTPITFPPSISFIHPSSIKDDWKTKEKEKGAEEDGMDWSWRQNL